MNHDHMSHQDHTPLQQHNHMDHMDMSKTNSHHSMDHESMAHEMMDHDANSSGHHMMMMFFHGGVTEVVLFDGWRIHSVGGLAATMVALFLLGILYEGLKFMRDYIYTKNVEVTNEVTPIENGNSR